MMLSTIFQVIALSQAVAPRDLELPLPLNSSELEIILVVLFLLHILFVNLMVGASMLTVLFEILGQTWQKYDLLAQRIGETITVNKSLAVVLGVGPMLCINLLYTTHFYSANALTGYAWISIVPLVIAAFLLTYLHKYMWRHWVGKDKRYHIMLGGATALLFLSIPLIFLANVNLMLFPDEWIEVRGFFSSLQVGKLARNLLQSFLCNPETVLAEPHSQELEPTRYRVDPASFIIQPKSSLASKKISGDRCC